MDIHCFPDLINGGYPPLYIRLILTEEHQDENLCLTEYILFPYGKSSACCSRARAYISPTRFVFTLSSQAKETDPTPLCLGYAAEQHMMRNQRHRRRAPIRDKPHRRSRLKPTGEPWWEKASVKYKHKSRIVAEEPEDDETDDTPLDDDA